jgi:hypothetical protein
MLINWHTEFYVQVAYTQTARRRWEASTEKDEGRYCVIMWAELRSPQWRPVARFWEQSREGFDKICPLPAYYAASSGSSVLTFRDNLSVPS